MMKMRKTKLAGTGSYLPEKVLTNADLEKMVDTSDEWIRTRTGIKERRIVKIIDLCLFQNYSSIKCINLFWIETNWIYIQLLNLRKING